MNIDERLEALVQSVELIAGMQRENEERMGQFGKSMERLERAIERTTANVDRVAEKVDRLADFVNDHEERLLVMEGGRTSRIERFLRDANDALRRIEQKLEHPNGH